MSSVGCFESCGATVAHADLLIDQRRRHRCKYSIFPLTPPLPHTPKVVLSTNPPLSPRFRLRRTTPTCPQTLLLTRARLPHQSISTARRSLGLTPPRPSHSPATHLVKDGTSGRRYRFLQTCLLSIMRCNASQPPRPPDSTRITFTGRSISCSATTSVTLK